jgi:hypothetical protein
MAASRWSWSRLRDRQREARGPDLADMGTAFALDASLEWESQAAAPVADDHCAEPSVSTRATGSVSSTPAARWWHRRGILARN